ncbi:hypothetical protein [Streptomyces sp. cg36]|uniref:hypothetical protein n=1 Tax=Streptomyces sp. cg36 TaxID=3238798 RepID=UPI0034E2C799
MTTPPPLPESVILPNLPVIRRRAYLAVAVREPRHLSERWHVWHARGRYVGYCTAVDLIDLTIAQDERANGQ